MSHISQISYKIDTRIESRTNKTAAWYRPKKIRDQHRGDFPADRSSGQEVTWLIPAITARTIFEGSFKEGTNKSGGLDLNARRGRNKMKMLERCRDLITYVSPPRVLSRCLRTETPSSPYARAATVREADRQTDWNQDREGERGERRGMKNGGELLFSLAESAQKVPKPDLKWKSVAGPRDNSVETERTRASTRTVDKLIKKSTRESGESMNIISDKYLSFAGALHPRGKVAIVDCARYPITKWPCPKRGHLAGNNATLWINQFKSADSHWIEASRNILPSLSKQNALAK